MDEGWVNPFLKLIHLLALPQDGSKVQDQFIRQDLSKKGLSSQNTWTETRAVLQTSMSKLSSL